MRNDAVTGNGRQNQVMVEDGFQDPIKDDVGAKHLNYLLLNASMNHLFSR